MIIVDSSVWIDYFNGKDLPEVTKLDELLETELLGIGDLILAEVLQGFRQDSDYQQAKQLLTSLTVFEMLGSEAAISSADNFRALRKKVLQLEKQSMSPSLRSVSTMGILCYFLTEIFCLLSNI